MYLQVLVFYKPDILRVIVVSVIGVNVSFHGFGFTLCRGNTQKKKGCFYKRISQLPQRDEAPGCDFPLNY